VIEGDRLVELSGAPPLSAKFVAGEHGHELILVSSAATFLEDDRLSIELVLGAGSSLTVRSTGAQLAFPCLGPGSSALDVHVTIGPGASLVWRPEPLVACAGCRHTSAARVELADATSRVLWWDELVLGRTGEAVAGIDLTARLRIDRAGRAVLRDGVRTAASEALGGAVFGNARFLATVVDSGWGVLDSDSAPGSMSLAGGGHLLRVVEPTAVGRDALHRQLDDLLHT
jgi:urease accessory protein